jgi:hypothetical protein
MDVAAMHATGQYGYLPLFLSTLPWHNSRRVKSGGAAHPGRWRSFVPVWIILTGGVLISLLLGIWFRAEALRTDERRFAGMAERTRESIDLLTSQYQGALQRIADSLGAKETLTEKDWRLAMNQFRPDDVSLRQNQPVSCG